MLKQKKMGTENVIQVSKEFIPSDTPRLGPIRKHT